MSHLATIQPARSAMLEAGRPAPRAFPAAPAGDRDPPPVWSPARIDLARRLWGKGIDEAAILAAINALSGAPLPGPQAIVALARRLCWPGPRQKRLPLTLATRDGSPSIAEREAAELAHSYDFVELPMQDAVAWGTANRIARVAAESDAALLARINRARAGWGLPCFRVTRPELAPPILPRRGKPAAGRGLRRSS